MYMSYIKNINRGILAHASNQDALYYRVYVEKGISLTGARLLLVLNSLPFF